MAMHATALRQLTSHVPNGPPDAADESLSCCPMKSRPVAGRDMRRQPLLRLQPTWSTSTTGRTARQQMHKHHQDVLCVVQVAKDWDTAKNPGSPQEYTTSSGHQAHWLCNKCGHGWQTSIGSRVKHRIGCPHCASIRRRR